jgi:Protein of unknown function (DUF559)
VVSRPQLLAAGMTHSKIRACLAAGRWQRISPGVYATFTGPLSHRARLWAALLRAGDGAVAGPQATLWLVGVRDRPPDPLDVVVPVARRVRGAAWFVVTRRRGLSDAVHPTARPPRLRVEDAVLDACAAERRPEAVVDLVLTAVHRRLTTADRLAVRLAARSRHRWVRLLASLLSDVRLGLRSALELRWLTVVVRPHGLPTGVLNRADDTEPRRRYRDVEFVEWGLVVELDGRQAHPDERFRDRRRDNLVTVSGRRTLRYGWQELVEDPCGVAAEVAGVLRSLGWTGTPGGCGPRCPVAMIVDGRGRRSDHDFPRREPPEPPGRGEPERVGGWVDVRSRIR